MLHISGVMWLSVSLIVAVLFNPFQGCRSVEEFQCLNRIEEGTYGVVYRAKDKKTGTKLNKLNIRRLLADVTVHVLICR